MSCIYLSLCTIFLLTTPRLQGLLDKLHSDECRELKDRLAAVSFQYDVLGSLPIEIVAQVSNYLGLSDVVILQRVRLLCH